MEDFVAQDLLEDRARRRVVVDALPIDRKAAGRSFFRDVQEREQPWIGLVFDDEVVEPMSAGQRVAVEKRPRARGRAAGAAPRRAGGTASP